MNLWFRPVELLHPSTACLQAIAARERSDENISKDPEQAIWRAANRVLAMPSLTIMTPCAAEPVIYQTEELISTFHKGEKTTLETCFFCTIFFWTPQPEESCQVSDSRHPPAGKKIISDVENWCDKIPPTFSHHLGAAK